MRSDQIAEYFLRTVLCSTVNTVRLIDSHVSARLGKENDPKVKVYTFQPTLSSCHVIDANYNREI